MPCVDSGQGWPSTVANEAYRDVSALSRRVQALEATQNLRLDQATNAACVALKLMEDANTLGLLPPEVIAWWIRHKEEDDRREAKP